MSKIDERNFNSVPETNEDDIVYFLLIGNGRTGSTWLSTSLDHIHDVFAGRELKWGVKDYELLPVHYGIDSGTESIKEAIDNIYREDMTIRPEKKHEDIKAIGSKLMIDPYYYYTEKSFYDILSLSSCIDMVIILHRKYRDIFLSWKCRGVYYKFRDDDSDKARDLYERYRMDRPSDPKLRTINLTRERVPLQSIEGEGPQYEERATQEIIEYDVYEAIDDLLQLFYNDLQLLKNLAHSDKVYLVDYRRISERLPAILGALGSSATKAQIEDVLEAPPSQKLERLTPDLIRPMGVIDRLSDILEETFFQVAAGEISVDDVWQWKDNYSQVHIHIPALKHFLDSISGNEVNLSWERFLRIVRSSNLVWTPRKPIFPAET